MRISNSRARTDRHTFAIEGREKSGKKTGLLHAWFKASGDAAEDVTASNDV